MKCVRNTVLQTSAGLFVLLSSVGVALGASAGSVSVTMLAPQRSAEAPALVTLRAKLALPRKVGPIVVHFFVDGVDLGAVCPGKPQKRWNTSGWTAKTYEVIARVYRWDRKNKARGRELAASAPLPITVSVGQR